MVSFALLPVYVLFFIHQAANHLNYDPVVQSQGHQSMSLGMALYTVVSCFGVSQSGWVFHKAWFGVAQYAQGPI